MTNLSIFIERYGITTVASLGILLNLIGVAFLIAERRKSVFNLLLSTLLIFDTLFLVFNLIKSVGTHFAMIPAKYLKSYSIIVYSGSRFSHISSIFMTVALSHSRFKAVNKPIQHRIFLKLTSNRIKYLIRYIIPVIFSSVVLTIPILWEYDINVNGNISNITAELMPSNLRQNPYYSIFYVGILGIGLLGVLPVSLLVYYTIKISKSVRQNSLSLGQLTNEQKKDVKIFNQKTKYNYVVNLIVIIFLIFHSLRLALTVVEFVIQVYSLNKKISIHEIGRNIPLWLKLFSSISELLLMVNSSVNTLIYKAVNGLCARSSLVETKPYINTTNFESRKNIQPMEPSRQTKPLISNSLTNLNGVQCNESPSEQLAKGRKNSLNELSHIDLSIRPKTRKSLDAEITFDVIKCEGEFV